MSFYINNTNPSRPGPVMGNPLNGICEKILIETTKVFDACVSQSTETGIVLAVTDLTPASPATPLTFISAVNAPNQDVTISDLVVDRLESCPNYANVSANITIPVLVNYRDADGVLGTGTSSITVSKNVVLYVPQPSVTPINISASAVFSSEIGSYTAENTFTVTGCLQVIIRVTAVVDVLIPSYGYPVIPPCHAAPAASACPGVFEMPLYPTASGPVNSPRF